MGIPSYFSHIIKTYPQIIQTWRPNTQIDNLYLDSNSIIYDVYYQMEKQEEEISDTKIIQGVIQKINYYLNLVQPKKQVMIALDGVAPVAKLEQQRQRRYKSRFQNQYNQQANPLKQKEWSTAQITPGTPFMEELATQLSLYYKPRLGKDLAPGSTTDIYLTTSLEPGEGEHKIFQHMRNQPSKEKTIIYGLDADLIILALNHLDIFPNLYLLREAPHFHREDTKSKQNNKALNNNKKQKKQEQKEQEQEELLLLDIAKLGEYLPIPISEYVVLTFFLGNDFLPHFPATNIRTTGIDTLIDAWKHTGLELIQNGGINRIHLQKWVSYLANQEQTLVQEEYEKRNKKEAYVAKTLENIPMWRRELEHYWIQGDPIMSVAKPFPGMWKQRYYQTFFPDTPPVEDICSSTKVPNIEDICKEYLERLEWTWHYYHATTKDWKGHYPFSYPPLYTDLALYLEKNPTKISTTNTTPTQPVSPMTQLCYVLPKEVLKDCLPKTIYDKYWKKYQYLYEKEPEFIWAFCKYFWEAHAILPKIDLEELETYLKS
jgi:5'-3' exonuclease